jgi:hypothetical protein
VKLRFGAIAGLVLGLLVIVGSIAGGVAFAHRGAGSPAVVVDNPLPLTTPTDGADDSGHHGVAGADDTPHATPSRSGNDADADDAVASRCEDDSATATDCRRGADHDEDD